jgi:hypothetical protein
VAIGLFVGWVFWRLLNIWLDDWLSRHLERPVVSALKWLLAQPVGIVGLTIALWVVALLGLSYLDSSRLVGWLKLRFRAPSEADLKALRDENARLKAPKLRPPPPPSLSFEETKQIQFVRIFWTEYGSNGVHRMIVLAEKLRLDLHDADRLVDLMRNPIAELGRNRQRLNEALQSYPQTPHSEIMSFLRSLTDDYLALARWVHYCLDRFTIDLTTPPYAEISDWPAAHQAYKTEITRLAGLPENEGFKHYVGKHINTDRFGKGEWA